MNKLPLGALLMLIATSPGYGATPSPKDDLPPRDAPVPAGSMNQSMPDKKGPDMKGVVSWRTLGKVEEVKLNNRLVPKFNTEITALDTKEVKLQGFIMPLEAGKQHKRFLLSANVPSCPFCMPGGPDTLIEVVCKDPIAYVGEPVIMSGRFSVLKDDPTGLWYRLTDAVLVSP